MRTSVVRLILVVVVLTGGLALFAAPALADSGAPFNPADGRAGPLTGDRVAIYCNADNVDVWGIDNASAGFHLTTFSLSELTNGNSATHSTPAGTVSLKMDSPAQVHIGYLTPNATTLSVITDVGAVYDVSWRGVDGADGSAPFDKSFSCTYLK
jgi:hypothetical protein